MKNKTPHRHDMILREMLNSLEVVGTTEGYFNPPPGYQSCRRPTPEFIHAGVPYEPAAWLNRGGLDEAERRAFSRALQDLKSTGLIEGYGTRTTHIRPTPAGLREAIRAARKARVQADVKAILKALSLTTWSTPEIEAAAIDAVDERPARKPAATKERKGIWDI